MAIVLSDVYSAIRLAHHLDHPSSLDSEEFADIYHIIENLVLCDKLLFEKTRGEKWAVASTLSRFCTPIEYVPFSGDQNTFGSGSYSDPYYWSDVSDALSLDNFLSRSSEYLCQATKLGVYLSIHPSRGSFLVDTLKHNVGRKASDIVISHTENIMRNSEAYKYASVQLSVPPVVDYVLSFAKKNQVNLETAVNEIRESDHAHKFRLWCAEIDVELVNATGRSSISLIQKLLLETEKVVSLWREDIDESVKYVSRKISLKKVWGIGKLLEALGIDVIKIKDPILTSPTTNCLFFLNDIYRPIHRLRQNHC